MSLGSLEQKQHQSCIGGRTGLGLAIRLLASSMIQAALGPCQQAIASFQV